MAETGTRGGWRATKWRTGPSKCQTVPHNRIYPASRHTSRSSLTWGIGIVVVIKLSDGLIAGGDHGQECKSLSIVDLMLRGGAARRLLLAAECLCRGPSVLSNHAAAATQPLPSVAQLAWTSAGSNASRWRGLADQPSGVAVLRSLAFKVVALYCCLPPTLSLHAGSNPAPGSDAADSSSNSSSSSSSTAAQQAAPQPADSPASSAEDSPAASSTAAAVSAEDARSLQAAAEASADLGAGEGDDSADGAAAAAAAPEDDAEDGEEAEDDGEEEEGYDSDIELTAAGLQYATTKWDGSRNMTPNRRPTREEREGYIDNEELQDEVCLHTDLGWQSPVAVLNSPAQKPRDSAGTEVCASDGTAVWSPPVLTRNAYACCEEPSPLAILRLCGFPHVPRPVPPSSGVIRQPLISGSLPQLDHVAVPVPGDIGLYDIQTTLPGLVSPTSAGLDALMEFGPDGIEAILQQARSSNGAFGSRTHGSEAVVGGAVGSQGHDC